MNSKRHAILVCLVWAVGGLLFTSAANAACLDLTSLGASGTINGAKFMQGDLDTATGTGLIDSFVRMQIAGSGTERGYNTDYRPVEFDETNTFNHSLQLVDVPTITVDGVVYREFMLDVNETAGKKVFISLDELKIHIEDTGNLTGYASFSTAIYDLDQYGDNWIKLDGSGSGTGDMFAFIPNSLFLDYDDDKYVYLYSEFGGDIECEDGFEEWAVGKDGEPLTPEPTTLLLLCIAAVPALLKRRRK